MIEVNENRLGQALQLVRHSADCKKIEGDEVRPHVEIEADMAEQLARVREMEKSGELEPIPEVSAE